MAAEPSDFVELGEVIGGYRLERLLGAGSTSQVFLGKHVVLGRRAAIKVLVHKLIGNEDVINRLLTEAKVVNDIRHPNIIDISDFINSLTPRRVALVMEYIEGPSLSICREQALTFEQAVGTMLQLVAAVRAAHAAGIIHRDIKPDNLLLTTDPRTNAKEVPALKIVDFGIAKMAHSNLAQTAVGTMLGTPAYMAPEQIAGRPRPSAATDVFAIGEVLYEVLTCKRAYPAGTISETVRAKLRGEIPDLRLPPMPGDKILIDVIRRCLSHRPEDRPGLQEIQNVLETVRPGGERIQTIEDLEDVDASEIDTRMVDHKPHPPAATTELTPLSGNLMMEEPPPTEANPIPHMRRFPKDITSPTNRVLPALTEIAPFSDRTGRNDVPNAPTMPGTLNRNDLLASAHIVRDEQSLSIGELRIPEVTNRLQDDESSVHISHFDVSRVQSPPPVTFDDEDPLRIAPPPKPSPKQALLDPLAESSTGLPALALNQPAGLQSFDRSTELDALDADDLENSIESTPFDQKVETPKDDSAATVPPKYRPPLAVTRPESGPDTPDTRITNVRLPATAPGTNRFFYVLLTLVTFGTALALMIATGRINLGGAPPVTQEKIEEPGAKERAHGNQGLFWIETEPSGADVMFVSEDPDVEPVWLGKSPANFQLSGSIWPRKLRIMYPDYEPFDVEVSPENNRINVKLRKR